MFTKTGIPQGARGRGQHWATLLRSLAICCRCAWRSPRLQRQRGCRSKKSIGLRSVTYSVGYRRLLRWRAYHSPRKIANASNAGVNSPAPYFSHLPKADVSSHSPFMKRGIGREVTTPMASADQMDWIWGVM